MFWILVACSGETEEKQVVESQSGWQEFSVFDSGPFQVGHIQIEHSYRPLEDQEERSILVEIWYPTEETSGTSAQYYLGTDEYAFTNATPAAPIHNDGYPVHVSSHGYRGWGANSPFLMRHFASHGWVVIAPNHTNNTIGDHSSPLPINHFVHRPNDITQSLNLLEEGRVELAGKINTERVVLSGHSFGASYSTWASAGASYDNIDAVCFEGVGLEDPDTSCSDSEYSALSSGELADSRVAVAIPMAGHDRKAFFGDEGYKSVDVPLLFVSGTEDNEEGNQAHFNDIEGLDFRWLSLQGACHIAFTTGGCSDFDSQLGFDILNAYLLAYARQRLLGDDSAETEALLNGSTQPWTEATIQVKE